jgi:SpoVK/Ycf46/Vps4 family AAA+-type ATPase
VASNSTDSGTSQRVLGTFLTWLSEKCSSVFVAATANNISVLPPELLRKGRFDEIFFVDLPDEAERREIYSIHIAARGRSVERFDLAALAAASDGLSGAEIEESIITALFEAFYEERDIGTGDILLAIRETVPLSRTMEESIRELREWCVARSRSGSRMRDHVESGVPATEAEERTELTT